MRPDKPFPPECHRLLALTRDLLQAPDEDSILWLFKPVIFEFLAPRIVLLRLTGRQGIFERYLDFEGDGDTEQLLDLLRKHVDEDDPVIRKEGFLSLDVSLSSDETGEDGPVGTLLSFAFPPGHPIGTLSAFWPVPLEPAARDTLQAILQSLAELAGAAFGNVASKRSILHEASVSEHEAEEISRQLTETIQENDASTQERERIATTDVMTGLLNPRGFFERADQAMRVARRKKMKCSVVFADLDGLKAVNDTLGHDIGDRLLRAAGDVFAASFRESDVVARLGSDEFAAFALETAGEEALLERVNESISRFHRNSNTPYRVAFSIGVVECDLESSQSLEDYLAIADKRMYQHKRVDRHH